jgi:hypothetical protein
VGGAANFTNAPATGLATTVSLTTAAQGSDSVTFTNTNLMATSPILMSVSAYGGTDAIPMVIYRRSANSFTIGNVFDAVTTLNGTVTVSFGILNSNGSGP